MLGSCSRTRFKCGCKRVRWSSFKPVGGGDCIVVMYLDQVLTVPFDSKEGKVLGRLGITDVSLISPPTSLSSEFLDCSKSRIRDWLCVECCPCNRNVIVKGVPHFNLCYWKASSSNTRCALVSTICIPDNVIACNVPGEVIKSRSSPSNKCWGSRDIEEKTAGRGFACRESAGACLVCTFCCVLLVERLIAAYGWFPRYNRIRVSM